MQLQLERIIFTTSLVSCTELMITYLAYNKSWLQAKTTSGVHLT